MELDDTLAQVLDLPQSMREDSGSSSEEMRTDIERLRNMAKPVYRYSAPSPGNTGHSHYTIYD